VHQYSKQVFDIREKPANGSSTKDSQGHPLTLASRSDSSERFKVFPFREGGKQVWGGRPESGLDRLTRCRFVQQQGGTRGQEGTVGLGFQSTVD